MDLYAENILDHYKNPRNFGKLKCANCCAKNANPFCGDKMTMEIKTDEKGKVTNIKFSGSGCAISQAAASLLTEEVKGKSVKFVKEITNEQMYAMLGVPISSGRVKCALLGLATLRKALEDADKKSVQPKKTSSTNAKIRRKK